MLPTVLNNDYLCFSKDLKGVYLNVNPGFILEANIYDADDALGKNDEALPWAPYAELFRENDLRVVETGKTHMFLEHFKLLGKSRLYRTFKSPLLGASGKIMGVTGLSVPINPSSLISLSPQQTACLKELAKGYTHKQIGHVLGLAQKTVEHYLDTVKLKLDCKTRAELIMRAIERGMVDFL